VFPRLHLYETEGWLNIDRETQLTVATLEAHKALDVVALDLRNLCDATDFFVIASGSSDTHVRALAERVLEALADAGRKPHHVEGVTAGRWALLDFIDFVVDVAGVLPARTTLG
jgi:ribosome-associated protein